MFPIDDLREKVWESSLSMGFSEPMARKWTTEEGVLENSTGEEQLGCTLYNLKTSILALYSIRKKRNKKLYCFGM